MTYERFWDDARAARENFHHTEMGDTGLVSDDTVTLVDAGANTGTRYLVIATRLDNVCGTDDETRELVTAEQVLGGAMLVSVVYPTPYSGCYVFGDSDYIDSSYVAEKFGRGAEWHGGDLEALTMAIRRATGRLTEYPL